MVPSALFFQTHSPSARWSASAYSKTKARPHPGYDSIVAMAVDPSSSEEQRIVAEYHIATEKYTAAVGELTQLRATMTAEDYTKLLNIV